MHNTNDQMWLMVDDTKCWLKIDSEGGLLMAQPFLNLPEGEVVRWIRPNGYDSDGELIMPAQAFRLVIEKLDTPPSAS